jgi:hypothetical protein
MSGTCPSCGSPVDPNFERCQKCGQATVRRTLSQERATFRRTAATAAPPPEITLPASVPGARFMAGETWTHGLLYLTEAGLYYLSESDGPWTPEKLAAIAVPDPLQPASIGTLSHFLPLNRIKKVEHSRFTSFNVITTEGPKPLRLDTEGWKLVDGWGVKVAISTT